jgi:hypothetical protein
MRGKLQLGSDLLDQRDGLGGRSGDVAMSQLISYFLHLHEVVHVVISKVGSRP